MKNNEAFDLKNSVTLEYSEQIDGLTGIGKGLFDILHQA